jgi:hypothetical protein
MCVAEETEQDSIQIPVAWVSLDEAPILLANQFLIQGDPDGGFILAIAQMAPPLLMGTPEERKEQAKQLGALTVKVLGRYSLSRSRAQALAGLLTNALELIVPEEKG